MGEVHWCIQASHSHPLESLLLLVVHVILPVPDMDYTHYRMLARDLLAVLLASPSQSSLGTNICIGLFLYFVFMYVVCIQYYCIPLKQIEANIMVYQWPMTLLLLHKACSPVSTAAGPLSTLVQ